MFGIGGFELFIILLFGFLVFGPDKLPEIARTLGAALRKFQQAQQEMEAVIKDEVLDVDGSSGAGSSKGVSAKPQPTSTGESFAARKAAYDKQRAKRDAAVRAEQARNREAMKARAAQEAAEIKERDAAAQSTRTEPQAQDTVPAASSVQPTLTPDELFGTTPIRPAAHSSHSQGGE